MYSLTAALKALMGFPQEYWSRLTAKDISGEQMKFQNGSEASEVPGGQDLHTGSHADEQMEVDEDSEETGEFHEATQHADSKQHENNNLNEVSLISTGPFYPDKLLFRNVDHNVTKELLVNYLENICGQDCLEVWYSDDSRHVLATFKSEVDFVKVTSRCQAKPLTERLLTVCRVPVSHCILAETGSSTIDAEHVHLYFENPRANGGIVLTVKPVERETKFVVCFKDAEVIDRILRSTHKLGGEDLGVRVYMECLGPSGGRTEPYIFQPPMPLKLADSDNMKICFLRHSASMLQTFNERLSEVNAHAIIARGVLWVNCTLTESMDRVDFLVEKWRGEVEKQLMLCFDLIRLERIEVPPEIWQDVNTVVEKTETSCDDLVLMFAEQRTFVVLNESSSEGASFQQLQSIVKVRQEEWELKKLEISDTKKLQRHYLDLLVVSSFLSDIRAQHKCVKIEIQPHNREIIFRGQMAEVKKAQVRMYDVIHSASSVVLTKLPNSQTWLLDSDGARDIVGKKLEAAGLCATWECKSEGVIIIYSLSERCLKQASHLIQASFKTETLFFDALSSSALTTGEWKILEDRLLTENPGILEISKDASNISITSVCDIMPAVKENVRKFVSKNTIYTAVFKLSPSRQKFLSNFWEEKLARMAEMLPMHHVFITLKNEDRTVLVRGTNKGIELVRNQLTSLAEKIKCTEELITIKETVMYLAGLENASELEPVGWTCQCVLSLQPETSEITMTSSNQPSESPRVTALLGDITALSVDAIVNAANELMEHGGGLAGHIVLKGGREIQEECYRLLRTRGSLSEGDVLVSGPGKLPCKAIIHAVGPRYKGGNKGEEECLEATVVECLRTASDRGFTSIAIPAISSGIFGYPVTEATRVIVESVRSFFSTNPYTRVRDVRLVDILVTTVRDFETALQANAYGSKSPVTEQGFTRATADCNSREECSKDSPWDIATAADKDSAKCSMTPVQPSDAKPLRAIKGDVTEQPVDVLVITADKELKHCMGWAYLIAKKGGEEIQKECCRILQTRDPLSEGDVVVSGPGKLPCKAIIHAVLPSVKSDTERLEEQMRTTVLRCLQTASESGYTSIALPIFSPWLFTFSVQASLHATVEAARFFLTANPESSISDVRLYNPFPFSVLDIQAALEEKPGEGPGCCYRALGVVTDKKSSPTSPSLGVPRTGAHFPGTDFEATSNPSTIGTPENPSLPGAVAEEASTGLNFGGISVTVKQGDLTQEDVDAVVNSTNAQMDLRKGAVSNVLKTKCGPDLESECETKLSDMAERRVVTTAAFNLRCKFIIHIDSEHFGASCSWKNAYADILKEAENNAVHSIAVPAIGTGNFKLSPSASARALREALDAHSPARKTVTTLNVVLFDPAMIGDFTDALKGEPATSWVPGGLLPKEQTVSKRLYVPETDENEKCTCEPRKNSVPDFFKIYVFAANQNKKAEVVKTLNSFVDGKYVEKSFKNSGKLLLEELEKICKKHRVELRKTTTGTVVRGLVQNCRLVGKEIQSIIKKAERKQMECAIANVVQWYYIEERSAGGKRIAYEKRENLLIELAYQGSKEMVELADAHGVVYVVSFKEMKDWAKADPSNSVKIVRKEIADWASSVSHLPETWEPQDRDQPVKRVPLQKGCLEYRSIEANMLGSASNKTFTITSIERIQNPELYKKYIAEKTQMEKRNNGTQSEKTLWHGTSSDTIDEINLKGFDRSFCGKNATCFGQGVYFAVNADYSMHDTYAVRDVFGRKHVYQCKVLVGQSTKGNSNMKVLPKRDENMRFDSATDNVSQPCMYVIFSDTQAYPEYLVTFH